MKRRHFVAKLPAMLAASSAIGLAASSRAQAQPLEQDCCSFQAGGAGAITRTVEGKLREGISVLDFIPVAEHAAIAAGTSSYDCAADFHNAIAAAANKVLRVPAGRYLVGSTITIGFGGIALVGDGEGLTSIVSSHGTADVLKVDCQNQILSYVQIRDLTLDAVAPKTGGYGLTVDAIGQNGVLYFGDFRNLTLGARMFAGVRVQSSLFLNLDNITVHNIAANQSGFLFRGIGGVSKNVNSWVSRCRVLKGTAGFVTCGFLYDSYSEGLYMSDCTFESDGLNYSLKIDNSLAAAHPPQNIWLTRIICDYAANHGFLIIDARTVRMTDCWGTSANGQYGIWLLAGVDVEIKGASCIGNREDGLRIDSLCRQVRIIGGVFDANGTAAANTYSGIVVNSNTCDFQISGADFFREGSAKTQRHSINVLGGSSDRYLIVNNNLYGYVTSPLVNGGGAGPNRIVAPNLT